MDKVDTTQHEDQFPSELTLASTKSMPFFASRFSTIDVTATNRFGTAGMLTEGRKALESQEGTQ